MQVDKVGIYLTRDKREAEVNYLDDATGRACGNIKDHYLSWKRDGHYLSNRDRGCDLIKYIGSLPLTNQEITITLAKAVLKNNCNDLEKQLAESVLKGK